MFLKVAFHYVETLTDKQVSEMDWNTKVNYLKRNPVTVARQIDYVFKQLWGNVILSRMHPIGVENWILKIEGSSKIEKHMHEHICMLLFKEQMLQELMKMRTEFVEFIDNHITCALPDETKYPERSNLESHHHRIFCRMKKGLAWIQWSLGTIRWN